MSWIIGQWFFGVEGPNSHLPIRAFIRTYTGLASKQAMK